ncbi:MAG: M1 family metallopeptidase [Candidatus Xenobia bacterium]
MTTAALPPRFAPTPEARSVQRRRATSQLQPWSPSAAARPGAPGPQPGANGIGDPYYPNLGNGGYLADHYDVSVVVDMDHQSIQGTTVMDAKATQDLSAFSLDLSGFDVSQVTVNGAPATVARQDEKLVVTPSAPLHQGDPFQVAVSYSGTPQATQEGGAPEAVGWKFYDGGAAVVGEPNGAHNWFPVNDHPRDKATYTFHVTTPPGWTVAANGTRTGVVQNAEAAGPLRHTFPRQPLRPQAAEHPETPGRLAGGTTTTNWNCASKMAPYLATLQIGHFTEDDSTGPNGLPIRNFFPTDVADQAKYDFGRTGEMIDTFSKLFGPFPFEAYGGTVVGGDGLVGGALECQTNSVFDGFVVTGDRSNENVIAHELTHQWFGDNVSVKNWKDIFLCEGLASYGEWLWAEHTDGADAVKSKAHQVYNYLGGSRQPGASNDAGGLLGAHLPVREQQNAQVGRGGSGAPPPAVTDLLKAAHHGRSPHVRGRIEIGQPPADDLFDEQVYLRGALTLYALRATIGDQAFFAGLQAYQKKFAGGNAEIQDFINVMQDASKQDLTSFFNGWLFSTSLPQLPPGA